VREAHPALFLLGVLWYQKLLDSIELSTGRGSVACPHGVRWCTQTWAGYKVGYKFMARHTERLSSAKVKHAKTGLHPDGGGLYLQVTSSKDGKQLNKSWLFVFRSPHTGKRREMGLGSLSIVGLGEAREALIEARKLILAGKDPIEVRNAERLTQQAPTSKSRTFESCAVAYVAAHEASWRCAKHRRQWLASLRDFAFPVFGALPVDQVDTALVMQALTPLWAGKIDTGTRVRSRIEGVLDWARVQGYRNGENPARWRGHLDHLLANPGKAKRVTHHAAMPYADLPSFLERLREQGTTATGALEFLILTAARTAEALGTRWAEVDTVAKVWTIPGDRMKAGKEHRVPLSWDALAIIESVRGLDPVLVFPGARDGRPLNLSTFSRVLQMMGVEGLTTHGFRSTFRDWAGDRTAFDRETIEFALAHGITDATEAAYRRGTAMEKRRKLMEAWAKYCSSPAAGSNVVPLKVTKRG
jgi:integrase